MSESDEEQEQSGAMLDAEPIYVHEDIKKYIKLMAVEADTTMRRLGERGLIRALEEGFLDEKLDSEEEGDSAVYDEIAERVEELDE